MIRYSLSPEDAETRPQDLISYKIASEEPIMMEEAVEGTGEPSILLGAFLYFEPESLGLSIANRETYQGPCVVEY